MGTSGDVGKDRDVVKGGEANLLLVQQFMLE